MYIYNLLWKQIKNKNRPTCTLLVQSTSESITVFTDCTSKVFDTYNEFALTLQLCTFPNHAIIKLCVNSECAGVKDPKPGLILRTLVCLRVLNLELSITVLKSRTIKSPLVYDSSWGARGRKGTTVLMHWTAWPHWNTHVLKRMYFMNVIKLSIH